MPRVSPLGFRNLRVVFRVSLSKPYNFLLFIVKEREQNDTVNAR